MVYVHQLYVVLFPLNGLESKPGVQGVTWSVSSPSGMAMEEGIAKGAPIKTT